MENAPDMSSSSRWADEDEDDEDDVAGKLHGGSSSSGSRHFRCRTFSSGSGSSRSCSRDYLKRSKKGEKKHASKDISKPLKRRRGSYTVRFYDSLEQNDQDNKKNAVCDPPAHRFGGMHQYMSSPCLTRRKTLSECSSTGSIGFEVGSLLEISEKGIQKTEETGTSTCNMIGTLQERKKLVELVAVQTQTRLEVKSRRTTRPMFRGSRSPGLSISQSSPRLIKNPIQRRYEVVNVLNNNKNDDNNNNEMYREQKRCGTYKKDPEQVLTKSNNYLIKLSKPTLDLRGPMSQVRMQKRDYIVYQAENDESDEEEEDEEEYESKSVAKKSSNATSEAPTESEKRSSSDSTKSKKKSTKSEKSALEHKSDDFFLGGSGNSTVKDSFFDRAIEASRQDKPANQDKSANQQNPCKVPPPELPICCPPPPPPQPCYPPNGASMFQSLPPPPPGFCQEIRVNVDHCPPHVSTQIVPCPGGTQPKPPPPPPPPPQEQEPPPRPQVALSCDPNPCVPLQITCMPTAVYTQDQHQNQCCCQSRAGIFSRLSQDQRIRCQRCRVINYCRSIARANCCRSMHTGFPCAPRRDSNNNQAPSVYLLPPYQVLPDCRTNKWKSEYSQEFIDWSKAKEGFTRSRNSADSVEEVCKKDETCIIPETTKRASVDSTNKQFKDRGCSPDPKGRCNDEKDQGLGGNARGNNQPPNVSGGGTWPANSGYNTGYPSGGNNMGYPSGGNNMGYPSGGNNMGYPSGGNNMGYPSGGNNMGYPSGGNNMGYPSGGNNMGYPSGGNNMGYPSGGNNMGYPPGGNNMGYPPGGNNMGYPPGGNNMGYPPGGNNMGYSGAMQSAHNYNYSGPMNTAGNKPSEYVFLIGPGGTLVSGSGSSNPMGPPAPSANPFNNGLGNGSASYPSLGGYGPGPYGANNAGNTSGPFGANNAGNTSGPFGANNAGNTSGPFGANNAGNPSGPFGANNAGNFSGPYGLNNAGNPPGMYGFNNSGYPPGPVNGGGQYAYGQGYGTFSNANTKGGQNAYSSEPSFDNKSVGPAEYDPGLNWDQDPYPFFSRPSQTLYPRNNQQHEDNKQETPSILGQHHPHMSHVHYENSFPSRYGNHIGGQPSPQWAQPSHRIHAAGSGGINIDGLLPDPRFFTHAPTSHQESETRPKLKNFEEMDQGVGPGPWGHWGKNWPNKASTKTEPHSPPSESSREDISTNDEGVSQSGSNHESISENDKKTNEDEETDQDNNSGTGFESSNASDLEHVGGESSDKPAKKKVPMKSKSPKTHIIKSELEVKSNPADSKPSTIGHKGKIRAPIKPKPVKPTSPQTDRPSSPQADKPTSTKTGKPTSTQTGKPTSTKTGKPTSTQTGEPTSTKTGKPTSTQTGESTSPQPDKAKAPQPGKPTSPQHGKPTSPHPGKSTSPQPGKPTSPQPGKPTSPQPGKPTSPQPGKPTSPQPVKPTSPPTGKSTASKKTGPAHPTLHKPAVTKTAQLPKDKKKPADDDDASSSAETFILAKTTTTKKKTTTTPSGEEDNGGESRPASPKTPIGQNKSGKVTKPAEKISNNNKPPISQKPLSPPAQNTKSTPPTKVTGKPANPVQAKAPATATKATQAAHAAAKSQPKPVPQKEKSTPVPNATKKPVSKPNGKKKDDQNGSNELLVKKTTRTTTNRTTPDEATSATDADSENENNGEDSDDEDSEDAESGSDSSGSSMILLKKTTTTTTRKSVVLDNELSTEFSEPPSAPSSASNKKKK